MHIAVRLWLLAALFGGAVTAQADCGLTDVEVNITKAVWHNRCSKKNCAELNGTAVLVSRCDEPLAVQIRLVGHDAAGTVIAEREMWPYALSNVKAGEHPFSFDKWLKYDPAIRGFRIEVVQVRNPAH